MKSDHNMSLVPHNPHADPRVQDWLLVYSPWPPLFLCLGYVLMCWVGPKLMASRRPMELKPFLVAYNLAMVALSFYMFMEVMATKLKGTLLVLKSSYNDSGHQASATIAIPPPKIWTLWVIFEPNAIQNY